ncbi:hypothetical protein ACTWP5_07545 [Streptomyces sp. 4N509B]|uniref:hypothetical protein n=1 Tax=Streptomyces sp. 4N509B TaxID=3457413 RepID=UPI003FD52D74
MPPPSVRPRGNPGAAVALLLVGTVVFTALYGMLTGAVTDLEGQLQDLATSGEGEIDIAQLTWLAALPGGVFGVVAGAVGRRQGLVWLAGLLALAAMLLGETFGSAVLAADSSSTGPDAVELFFDHFSDMWESWTESAHGFVWPLLALAPITAVVTGLVLTRGESQPQHPQWTGVR